MAAPTLVIFFITLFVRISCGFNDIDAFKQAGQYKEAANRGLAICAAGSACLYDRITSQVLMAFTSLPFKTVNSLYSSYLGQNEINLTERMLNAVKIRRLQQKYGDDIISIDYVLKTFFNSNVTSFYDEFMAEGGSFEEIGGSILGQLRRNAGIVEEEAGRFWKSVNTLRGYDGGDVKQALTTFTNKTIQALTSAGDRSEYCQGLLEIVEPLSDGEGYMSLKDLFREVCLNVIQPQTRGLYIPGGTVARGYTTSTSRCGSMYNQRVSRQLRTTLTSLRVVGGQMTAKAEYKFLVTLVYRGYVICTGTVIDATHVMTAAHCTDGVRASELKVAIAEYDTARKDGEVPIQVKRIRNHPSYNRQKITNDIAILTLSRSVVGIKNVQRICLPLGLQCTQLNKRKCFVAGWGAKSIVGGRLVYPRMPRDGIVYAYNGGRCPYGSTRPTHAASQICATGPADTCNGDSGGPLFCQMNKKWVQCGITSFGPAQCNAPKTQGIYTKVPTYRSWIKKALQT